MSPGLRAALTAVAFAATAAFAAWCAYPVVFSFFAPWDDEGYMLIALKGFRDGLPLYDEVYGQYGPAFFVALSAIFTLFGLPVSHDAGRFVTLGLWLATSLCCGAAVWRMARSTVLGCAVVLLVFRSLVELAAQPLHPGALLVLLLAGMVAASGLLVPRRPRIGLLVIGAAAAGATLMKINVGVFAIVSLVFAWAVVCRPVPVVRLLRWAAALAMVGVPWALMTPDLGQDWARRYAALVALSALALIVAPLPSDDREPGDAVWLALGAAVATAVAVAVVLLGGTTVSRLLHAVFISPLGQRQALMLPLELPRWTLALGALSVAAACAVCLAGPARGMWSAVARGAAGLALCSTVAGLWPEAPLGFALLPLAWIAATPPAECRDAGHLAFARVLLASLAVLQALHAYPVAGAQVGWGSFLLLPAGAICLGDGLRQLAGRLPDLSPVPRRALRGLALALPVLLLAAIGLRLVTLTRPFRSEYEARTALGLPGATRLRMARTPATAYRWLADQLQRNCTTFVSLPGINSLYLLAGIEPPTALNSNAWMYLFDHATQARIVARLERIDALCLVENPAVLDFFTRGRALPPGPLVDYLASGFELIGARSGWVLKIRRNEPAPAPSPPG